MFGAWQRWSGALARSTDRPFERLLLPFVRLFWPTIDQVPPRGTWDSKGIDLLVWAEDGRFPCAVQCKGFDVQEIGRDQITQVLQSIESFVRSDVQCDTYLIIHNREGKNAEFRSVIEQRLNDLVINGRVLRAELWDRQQLLVRADRQLEQMIIDALDRHSRESLLGYERLFPYGPAYVPRVPASESLLRFRRYEPCERVPITDRKYVLADRLVAAPSKARWTLLTGQFGSGKTTTVLHAAMSSARSTVLIECRSLPPGQHQIGSTTLLLEEGLKTLGILDSFSDMDQTVLYEVAGLTFKNMLKRPDPKFLLILDGLDENRFFSRVRGMEFLSNQLADLKCPVILTTGVEHLDSMFGDFSAAFHEFSTKQGPKRDARLIHLLPWTMEQMRDFCKAAIEIAPPSARAKFQDLKRAVEDGSYQKYYGDLPSSPLMLQFIIEDVIESGMRRSRSGELIHRWIKRKIRRDASRAERVTVCEAMDVEEIVDRVAKTMEDVAGAMVDPESHELIEVVDSNKVLELAETHFEGKKIDLLSFLLHSLLMPVRPRAGSSFSLVFAFRVVQEYLLARFLTRANADVAAYPISVRAFVAELQALDIVLPSKSTK